MFLISNIFLLFLTLYSPARASASWNLDRIDQEDLPLNGIYNYHETGAGVHVYIIGYGINQHNDYDGRLSNGMSFSNISPDPWIDCTGHETSVASVVGGVSAGVAKHTIFHPVKTGCPTADYATVQDIMDAIDWINANHKKPAIVNISSGLSFPDSGLRNAIQNSIDSHKITYVVSGGNNNANQCGTTPKDVTDAIVVGASTAVDERWQLNPSQGSGFGSCIDIFAPGKDIWVAEAHHTDRSKYKIESGASLAAPHVTGCLARYLQFHSNAAPIQNNNTLLSTTNWMNAYAGIDKITLYLPPNTNTTKNLLRCPPNSDSPGAIYNLRVEHSDMNMGLLSQVPPPWENPGPASQHSNGADAHQYWPNTSSTQRWQLLRTGGGYYHIQNLYSGKCLGVDNGGLETYGQVHQWSCNFSSNTQKWLFEPIGDVSEHNYRIRNKAYDLCIDIEGNSTAPQAKAKLWSCHEEQNQQWELR